MNIYSVETDLLVTVKINTTVFVEANSPEEAKQKLEQRKAEFLKAHTFETLSDGTFLTAAPFNAEYWPTIVSKPEDVQITDCEIVLQEDLLDVIRPDSIK